MSRRASLLVAFLSLAVIAAVWLGGGWVWRQLLAPHGRP
jgi:hypothetical protein